MSLSNVFRTANIWKTFDNSKSLKGKFRQKVVFFDGGPRIGVVVLCVLQLEESSVCVDVEVVCVLRPSSRMCFEESSFATTSSHIFDIRPIIRHLHTTSFFSSSLTYGLLFHGLLFHSRLRARGGFKGGYYVRGY